MYEDVLQSIAQEALLLIPALNIVGAILKRTPRVPDWCIPWALLALSIAASLLLLGASVESAIQGLLACGASVFLHQVARQTREAFRPEDGDA